MHIQKCKYKNVSALNNAIPCRALDHVLARHLHDRSRHQVYPNMVMIGHSTLNAADLFILDLEIYIYIIVPDSN
jgi:hypothetical protein